MIGAEHGRRDAIVAPKLDSDASCRGRHRGASDPLDTGRMNYLPWRQVITRITLTAVFLISLGALGARGDTTGDRAISGGGIGAGVGALGGLIVGAPIEGTLIGGAVGAGTGALTDKDQIDLGKPIWR